MELWETTDDSVEFGDNNKYVKAFGYEVFELGEGVAGTLGRQE